MIPRRLKALLLAGSTIAVASGIAAASHGPMSVADVAIGSAFLGVTAYFLFILLHVLLLYVSATPLPSDMDKGLERMRLLHGVLCSSAPWVAIGVGLVALALLVSGVNGLLTFVASMLAGFVGCSVVYLSRLKERLRFSKTRLAVAYGLGLASHVRLLLRALGTD